MSLEAANTVFSTTDALQAEMIRMALSEEGIDSQIDNPHQGGFTGAVEVKVSVSAADRNRALQIVKEVEDRAGVYTLVVTAFDNESSADEVQSALRQMEKSWLIDLNDSVVIIRDRTGKVMIRQTHHLTQDGALAGGLCGVLVGAMFMNPVAGLIAGAAVGAAVGATEDIGINDQFLRDVGDSLVPGTSALAVLIRRADPDLVLPELQKFDGRILKMSLLHTDEQRFLTFLEAERE
ncbi:MAG: DUF1269 domain-containing protein [Fuerstiella sp.]